VSIQQLKAANGIRLISSSAVTLETLTFQDLYYPDRPAAPFDVRVRRAMIMAIDRASIVKTIYQGLASAPIGDNAWFPFSPGFDKSLKAIPFDPAGARNLLKQAGQTTFRFDLHWKTDNPSNPPVAQLSAALVSYWKDVGINAQSVPHPSAELTTLLNDHRLTGGKLADIPGWTPWCRPCKQQSDHAVHKHR